MEFAFKMSDGSIYYVDGPNRDRIHKANSGTGWARFAEVDAEQPGPFDTRNRVRVQINVDHIVSIEQL